MHPSWCDRGCSRCGLLLSARIVLRLLRCLRRVLAQVRHWLLWGRGRARCQCLLLTFDLRLGNGSRERRLTQHGLQLIVRLHKGTLEVEALHVP